MAVLFLLLTSNSRINPMRPLLAVWLPSTFSIVCLIFCIKVSLGFAVPLLLGIGDVVARAREYRRLRKEWSAAAVRRMRKSMCQRFAAIAASEDMGYTRRLFRNMGYRWYHILPDGSFSIRNNCFLTISFYMRLLGINKSSK